MDDELLAEAVDEAMSPAVEEVWAPIRAELRARSNRIGLAPAPWLVDHLAALVRARALGEQ